MSKPRKSPSANENWVSTETVNEYKKAALKTLDECKKREAETPGKWVKVSDLPKTFKRVLTKQ